MSILRFLPVIATAVALTGAAGAGEGLPAFPGAEGFGSTTPGGRGGKVYLVTNLRDSGPGSFRAAVEAKGRRIVIFRVSGNIELRSYIKIRNPYLTIAGQTAPGGGICLRNFGCQIRANDVVMRYLRIRPGDTAGREQDALSVYLTQNVIIDHCSTSWGTDETLSVSGAGTTNVTVQWCMITESLNQSVHKKGAHGYGSLIRTNGDITFHHNVYAHHKTRCPRPGTYGKVRRGPGGEQMGILLDFRNNLIYDWISPAGYSMADRATLNYVGNYLKRGPSTTDRGRVFSIGSANTRMFVADNFLEGTGNGGRDGWGLISGAKPGNKAARAYPTAPVRTDTAAVAYRRLLEGAGATLPARDTVDSRIVEEIRRGRGRVINSQKDVGGWPALRQTEPPADSDRDGMPDEWERRYRLNPRSAADNARDQDGDGYTNVEEYINGTDPTAAEAATSRAAPPR